MTDEPEKEYDERVQVFLEDEYGEENVVDNRHLSETYRFADFWVEAPLVNLAIEVENDAKSIIEGFGQAHLYAAHDPLAVPVIIVPPGHVEQPEIDFLRWYIPIIELDV